MEPTANNEEFPAPPSHCGAYSWHPMVECEGLLGLVRLRHPLVGYACACLAHAIHAIRVEPNVSIVESLDPDLSAGIRDRAIGLFST